MCRFHRCPLPPPVGGRFRPNDSPSRTVLVVGRRWRIVFYLFTTPIVIRYWRLRTSLFRQNAEPRTPLRWDEDTAFTPPRARRRKSPCRIISRPIRTRRLRPFARRRDSRYRPLTRNSLSTERRTHRRYSAPAFPHHYERPADLRRHQTAIPRRVRSYGWSRPGYGRAAHALPSGDRMASLWPCAVSAGHECDVPIAAVSASCRAETPFTARYAGQLLKYHRKTTFRYLKNAAILRRSTDASKGPAKRQSARQAVM